MKKTFFLLTGLWAALSFAAAVSGRAQSTSMLTVSGVILLREAQAPDFRSILPALRKDWGFSPDSSQVSDKRMTLYWGGTTAVMQYVPYPMAAAEVRSAAEGAWLWATAREEAPRHRAQLTLAVLGSGQTALALYKIYTRVAAAALEQTRAYGIYLPKHYLLHSRDFFLEGARQINRGELPLYCWVYFGMFQKEGLSYAYTYGLDAFGMLDLELIRYPKSLAEAHAVLYDAALEALRGGKVWREGAVVESLDGEKFVLRRQRSPYLENKEMLRLEKL